MTGEPDHVVARAWARVAHEPRGSDATADAGSATKRTGAALLRGIRRSQSLEPFLVICALLVGIGTWVGLSAYFGRLMIPPPMEVVETALPMIRSGELLRHTLISLARIVVGFAAGSLFGIVVGLLMGRVRFIHRLLEPNIEVLRYLSPTAMIPIAVIWFGIGEMSKYFLIFWGTFSFVLINTIAGVLHTPVARQRAAACLGATNLQIFVLIVLPSSIPYIVTGMRIAMASSFMSIVPAEMLAADSGLGFLLQQSGLLVQTNRIFVALTAISLLGFVSDRAFAWLVRKTLSRYLGKLRPA